MRLQKTALGLLVIDDNDEIIEAEPLSASDETDEQKLKENLEANYGDKLKESCQSNRPLSFEKVIASLGLDESEARKRLKEEAIAYSEQKIKEDLKDDKEVISAIKTVDSLDQDLNDILEICRSWLDFYLSRLSSQQREKLDLEDESRLRAGDISQLLIKLEEGPDRANSGVRRLKSLTAALAEVEQEREEIEGWIENKLEEITPNLSALLEPLLTARLLEAAGSLEKLAKMPSSTVQVLGAEKALFRHMRGEGSSPKHGIIFLHPLVNQTKRGKRGKISRFLANKISIASRLDFYGGHFKGKQLKQELKDKFEQLKEE